MASSGSEHQVEEEERLVHLGVPAASQASWGKHLAISLFACALCALAWLSSPSWTSGSIALWKYSLTALYGSGMTKQKGYDWKDSNLALVGSRDSKEELKKNNAAEEWDGAGEKSGLEVWRINKFKVERMPPEDNGKFYEGDSYIVLNTSAAPEGQGQEFLYDLHFWIGRHSTQDEYGTAAHKSVELDTLLDDKPVMHKEVQGQETNLFKSYFDSITIMEGGVDSGFLSRKPVLDSPQMFRVTDTTITAVPAKLESLDLEHTFVFDAVTEVFLIVNTAVPGADRFKASQLIQDLEAGRTHHVATTTENGAKLTSKVKKALKKAGGGTR